MYEIIFVKGKLQSENVEETTEVFVPTIPYEGMNIADVDGYVWKVTRVIFHAYEREGSKEPIATVETKSVKENIA